MKYRTHVFFFYLYFHESTAGINFLCSNSRLRIGVNDMIFLKHRMGWNTKCGKLHKFWGEITLFFVRIAVLIVNYDFNPRGIFENMTSFAQILNQGLEQGILMAALSPRK